MFIRIFKKNPLFCVLLVVLSVISLASIKPDLFLMGWDNYSSYFNLKDQLFRTLFATWRDHRGLGVPSDSEVTDIFRQLFFLLVRPFGLPLSDQLYFVTSLWLGALGIYVFARSISTDLLDQVSEKRADLFAFIASFFYLFNLNTLSVYFFPIQPYNTRFFAIPIVFLFFRLILKNKFTIKQYILTVLLLFFSSTAYVIGTVFVTLMIAISLYSVWNTSVKKAATVIIFFLLINAFWLLPFTNYTIQKSKLIRLAPTFISANESQLNKQKSFYSFFKQAVLYPNFFETEYSSNDLAKKYFLHPLAATWHTFPTNIIIGIFPLLYLLGCALILYDFKKRKKYLWIPSIILLFLFLSMKEFSPLGFLYSFFDDHAPLFGVLFRFGDTKFHPFIAFAGSVAAAYVLTRIINKKILIGVLATVVVGTLIVFKSYYSGQLVGFFMYNKVPDAYFKIADTINSDPEEGRVLHLPYDRDIYWRSYKWGYIGSEFLGFMLSKPLVDKTFEPASPENAVLLKNIYDDLSNIQGIQTLAALDSRVLKYYDRLKRAGIRYVIVDPTVSAENVSRDAVFWGTYNVENPSVAMNRLQELNLAKVIRREGLGNDEIMLFFVTDPDPRISFVKNTEGTDSQFDNTLFARQDRKLTQTKSTVSIEASLPQGSVQIAQKPVLGKSSHMVRVSAQKNEKGVVFSFYYLPYPSVNSSTDMVKIGEITALDTDGNVLNNITHRDDETFINNWHVLDLPPSKLRIRVDGTLLPVPTVVGNEEQLVGDVVVHSKLFDVSVLGPDKEQAIPLGNISLTSDPNCYNDKLSGYESSLEQNDGLTTMGGKNGSVCSWISLSPYLDNKTDAIELSLDMEGRGEDMDAFPTDQGESAKPILESVVRELSKPVSTEVCIRESSIDNCLNSHSMIVTGNRKAYRFTVDRPVGLANDLSVLIALKNNGFQNMEMNIHLAKITTYALAKAGTIEIPSAVSPLLATVDNESLEVSFVKPLSRFSYYFQPGVDGFYLPSSLCDKKSSYRTNRLLDTKLVSWAKNCQTNLFASIPFSSDNFYLWSIDYNLASGQYPKFVLEDGFNSYLSRLVSLDQGYPDIPEFKTFQRPEILGNRNSIRNKLEKLEMKYAYSYINPSSGLGDFKNKNFTIEQYTENEGLMLVRGFDVVELPTDWQNLQLTTGQPAKSFDMPISVRYNRILPSLWKVDMIGQAGQNYLLRFNEAYDNQWLMSGATSHSRCYEFANCFQLKGRAGAQSYYIFYWPEVLNILGWVITTGSVLFLFRHLRASKSDS